MERTDDPCFHLSTLSLSRIGAKKYEADMWID